MRLSIITINYNNAEGLKQTIESIKCQTYNDFEYIVIDGNSKDHSLSVIKQYDSYITKWVSEPDSGIYNAMNKGANISTGDYLLFLNSGDFLYSNDAIKQIMNESYEEDIVCFSMYSFSKNIGYFKLPPHNISLYTFIDGGSMLHPSTLISRRIYNKIGGYIETYKIISDWCFFIDALIVNNCSYKVFENIVLSSFNCYGISSSSINNIKRKEAQDDFLRSRFPRIIEDYLPLSDEALSNTATYISTFSGVKKTIFSFPAKLFNRIFNLRNQLNKRTRIKKKYK